MHAGLDFEWLDDTEMIHKGKVDAQKLNVFFASIMNANNRGAIESLFGVDESPLMTRHMSHTTTDCASVRKIIKAMEVKRIVVGHTIMANGKVTMSCSGMLVLTDVASSRWIFDPDADEHSGYPSAVLMSYKKGLLQSITSHYEDNYSEVLWTESRGVQTDALTDKKQTRVIRKTDSAGRQQVSSSSSRTKLEEPVYIQNRRKPTTSFIRKFCNLFSKSRRYIVI